MASSTQDKILDAAETLFADRGFDASLREITAEAGVNLAAVNYHFGSKDALIRAVFARRLEPLNGERLSGLDALEREAGDDSPAVEPLVEAFVGPAIRMSRDPRGAVFMRLFGHTLSQRDDRIIRMFSDQFREVLERFSAAFGAALGEPSREEVFWRLLFTVGAMAHTMALSDKLSAISGGMSLDASVESILPRLVRFVAAGIRSNASIATGAEP